MGVMQQNKRKRYYRRAAKTSLVLVYLVIIAGAVVRMTGSGMGCPDWPKCFGYYIPPTERAELEWQNGRAYKEGHVIIIDETLMVAKTNFNAQAHYDPSNWEPYTRHNYAEFNAFHTWTEFINRLFGALAGLGVLIMAIFSFGYWRTQKRITLLSWVSVLAMGFQGWLGATVVYSVLEPVKITLHMSMALVIVAFLLYLIFRSGEKQPETIKHPFVSGLVLVTLVLSLIQILMGTQVRQFVDDQMKLHGEQLSELWLAGAGLDFYFHRSFSIAILLANIYLAYIVFKNQLNLKKINWIVGLILAEVISGMAMYYLDFPFGTQAMHLVLAALLFGFQFYLLLESRRTAKSS
jgi:cytochrome c oxidase assembly protein subunit 15